jgi:EAL domain-containing protein (putative c-di-GMP-specific phosphodiesterase class I)
MGLAGSRLIRGLSPRAIATLLAALLAAALYWAVFDPAASPFVAGLVFGAAIALASLQAKLQRRSAQLRRAYERLRHEQGRGHRASEAFRLNEARFRALADAVPTPIFYVDRGEHCRFHNRAATSARQALAGRIDGMALRELLGEEAYFALVPHLALSLAGKAARHELAWQGLFTVHHEPFPAGAAQPAGVFLVFLPRAAVREAARAGAPEAQRGASAEIELRIPADGGESLYLRAVQSQLTGWDDPPAKLAAAMRENRFLLLQQRIVPLREGLPSPHCYEVLLRLQEEEDNLLPPGGFLALADSCGQMEEVDRWVVSSLVARVQEQKKNRGWQAPLYWVNLSRAAVASPEFARAVQLGLEAAGCDGKLLCFELAEPDILALPDQARRLVDALKRLGCRFAVDAFGSGKPAFAPLKALAVDFVKIDGAIVQNLLRNPAELARARALNAACQQMGVRTVAESVEDAATLSALRKMGVDYAQGFGLADPEPLFGRRLDVRQAGVPAAA